MSVKEKKAFMNKVKLLVDTREQKNRHITSALDKYGVPYESKKLDYGDYSFVIDGRDFSRSCVVERKANIDEVYGNIMRERDRIEKELDTISRNARHCVFMLENCGSWDELKHFELPDKVMEDSVRKVQNIGYYCYNTLRSWECGNRYNLTVEFVKKKDDSACRILESFYWFWHNYKKQTASRRLR